MQPARLRRTSQQPTPARERLRGERFRAWNGAPDRLAPPERLADSRRVFREALSWGSLLLPERCGKPLPCGATAAAYGLGPSGLTPPG